MHGARGGPKTISGHITCKKASFKHGCYSHEVREEMRLMRKLLKEENMSIKNVDDININNEFD